MFKNYFKIAWRNLWKNKAFSAINIVGLSIGMAACIVIMLFVLNERSFDNFHSKNIYRLNEVQKFEGMASSQKVALSMFPMGPTLKNDFPEVKNFTRVRWSNKYQMTYGEKRVYLPQAYFVDSSFLKMFDFKVIEGDRETALQKPNSVMLTKSNAEKIFGKENPMGKTITHYSTDTIVFNVTGIIEDVPKNSQMQFDGLFSLSSMIQPWMNEWGNNWLNTYLELAEGTDAEALEKKFPGYLKKYLPENDQWKNYELFLLPFGELHAGATDIGLDYINYQKFDKKYINIFSIIAIIVLLIACINFMNLSTARSAERAKEVGIRKTIGAQRLQLSVQFLGETVLLSLIALLIALLLVLLAVPFINNLSERELSLPFFSQPRLIFGIVLGTIVVGLLAGIYPAAYLSSFQPIKVLKGSLQTGRDKGTLRNILVIIQFSSAIFLMIATVFVVRQLSYMQTQDPGFSRDYVLNIPLDQVSANKFDVLKQELSGSTVIKSVTGAQDVLGSHLDQSGVEFKGDTSALRFLTSTRLIVDPDYLNLYKIPLVSGKNFSKEPAANGIEYIINESLAKELLKDNPKAEFHSLIGKHFGFDSLGVIVGIAKDFNFNSLHHRIETMFLFNQKDWGYRQLSIKINGEKTSESIAFIQSVWKKYLPDQPMEYEFLDEHFEEVYRSDAQVSKIVGVLATLSIIVSCLGLFGLASHSAEKRIREVGIRKVMGASVKSIVSLLSFHFVKLVLLANLIAWPLAWFALNSWLNDFAYRIEMSWWVFLLVGFIAILIALITVSSQAMKAAFENPIKSLRTE
jgi:putative ABC transport system permease protein